MCLQDVGLPDAKAKKFTYYDFDLALSVFTTINHHHIPLLLQQTLVFLTLSNSYKHRQLYLHPLTYLDKAQ